MAVISIAPTEPGHNDALDAAAEAVAAKGHDASVAPVEPPDARVSRAQFIVRFISDEDGRGLAQAARDLFLAFKRETGEFPERIALYDQAGRLLNDADPSLL